MGHRIVVPYLYRERMLQELHRGHFGVVKTKSAARARMWWPGIDGDIERWVGTCVPCAATRSAPPRAPPAPWPRPQGPWQRLHIDYMSVGTRVYLIVIDVYSKWLELECLLISSLINNGTATKALINKLKELFSRFGMPKVLVSDNDVKINSVEFNTFCKTNGIRYVTSPIYHPCSNGQAENSVKTCKKMLKCILNENERATNEMINEKLLQMLFDYRNTAHCATGVTPAKLLLGRELWSRLDLVLPNKKETVNDNGEKNQNVVEKKCRNFEVGDKIWLRWFIARK